MVNPPIVRVGGVSKTKVGVGHAVKMANLPRVGIRDWEFFSGVYTPRPFLRRHF